MDQYLHICRRRTTSHHRSMRSISTVKDGRDEDKKTSGHLQQSKLIEEEVAEVGSVSALKYVPPGVYIPQENCVMCIVIVTGNYHLVCDVYNSYYNNKCYILTVKCEKYNIIVMEQQCNILSSRYEDIWCNIMIHKSAIITQRSKTYQYKAGEQCQ